MDSVYYTQLKIKMEHYNTNDKSHSNSNQQEKCVQSLIGQQVRLVPMLRVTNIYSDQSME